MSRRNIPILTVEGKQSIERGYQNGKTHAFRKRYHLILLKSEG